MSYMQSHVMWLFPIILNIKQTYKRILISAALTQNGGHKIKGISTSITPQSNITVLQVLICNLMTVCNWLQVATIFNPL